MAAARRMLLDHWYYMKSSTLSLAATRQVQISARLGAPNCGTSTLVPFDESVNGRSQDDSVSFSVCIASPPIPLQTDVHVRCAGKDRGIAELELRGNALMQCWTWMTAGVNNGISSGTAPHRQAVHAVMVCRMAAGLPRSLPGRVQSACGRISTETKFV